MRNEERNALFYCKYDYVVKYYSDIDFNLFSRCPVSQARGKEKVRLNELFCMLDTETSKNNADSYKTVNQQKKYSWNPNYIVAWSMAINIYGMDVITVYGDSPDQIAPFLERMHSSMRGNKTIIYCHFLSYDFTFLSKFLFDSWGYPVNQLNTKPHYPISIEFSNGICFRDSLILSQTGIERWAKDLNAENQKAVGKWDYERIRHQHETFTEDEIKYIECDVLAGVECLAIMRKNLNSSYSAFPYTKTGIVRSAAREIGKQHDAHKLAVKCYRDGYEVYKMLEQIYHGGYTHANRHITGWTLKGSIQCYDFSSSYPFCLCVEKYPCEHFAAVKSEINYQTILENAGKFAYIFRFRANHVTLKNKKEPFPVLQLYKMRRVFDVAIDNGRILEAGYIDCYTNEIDFGLIAAQYEWEDYEITDVYRAGKRYLPEWLRNFIFDKYKKKCVLKNGDPVRYSLAKGDINCIYGMMVQHLMQSDIIQDYETGEFKTVYHDTPEDFEKAVKKRSTFLFYAYGCYCTSYAQRNVIQYLSYCVNNRENNALYIDTDSCYSDNWNQQSIVSYNRFVKAKLEAAGYGSVTVNGKEYVLGAAEFDGEYTEARFLGSKRYCCRKPDGTLKITVAGVPKKTGAACLKNDIENFKSGFIFDGETTGKLTHIYQYVEEIFENEHGDLIGDSINLVPCDYLLDESIEYKLDRIGDIEMNIQVYDDGKIL